MNSDSLALIQSFGVSRETIEKLKLYEQILRRWQRRVNLVANSTLDEIWCRHFLDSLQVLSHAPKAKTWVDMGSGAGFPGMPLAIHFGTLQLGSVHLIERDHRKCAFLREVARMTEARATIHHGDAVDIIPSLGAIEVVTARAVAPISDLIGWSDCLLKSGAIGLFLKGQDIASELTGYPTDSKISLKLSASQTGSDGKIVTAWYAVGLNHNE